MHRVVHPFAAQTFCGPPRRCCSAQQQDNETVTPPETTSQVPATPPNRSAIAAGPADVVSPGSGARPFTGNDATQPLPQTTMVPKDPPAGFQSSHGDCGQPRRAVVNPGRCLRCVRCATVASSQPRARQSRCRFSVACQLLAPGWYDPENLRPCHSAYAIASASVGNASRGRPPPAHPCASGARSMRRSTKWDAYHS